MIAKSWKIFVILCSFQSFLLSFTKASNIVGFPNLNYISHSRVLWKLGQELTSRGHNYTQLLGSCAKEKSLADVNVLIFNTSVTSERIEEVTLSLGKAGDINSLTGMWNLLSVFSESRNMSETFCEDLLLNKKIMAELKGSVDIVLCDLTNFCCSVFSEILEVPQVTVVTVAFMDPFVTTFLEMPEILVHMDLELGKHAGKGELKGELERFSFVNRLKNTLNYIFAHMFMLSEIIPSNVWNKHAKSVSRYSSASEAFWKTRGLVLVSHDFAFTHHQPLNANVKIIGPILPGPAKPLPAELNKFMSANKKVVLVSFGTVLSDYNRDLIIALAVGLSKLPVDVLWKHSGVRPKQIGSNTKIVPWIPQNDVLGHHSVVAFMTHGGLNSFQESVYHGVPMIVLPLFGDQHWSASVCIEKQLGVLLDKTNLEPQKVTEAFMEVLNNNVYKENVMKISKRLKRHRISPAEEGADWVEYALENDGALHLRSTAGDLAFYQRFMLDVFLVIGLITVLFVFLFIKLLMCIFCRQQEQRKEKKKTS